MHLNSFGPVGPYPNFVKAHSGLEWMPSAYYFVIRSAVLQPIHARFFSIFCNLPPAPDPQTNCNAGGARRLKCQSSMQTAAFALLHRFSSYRCAVGWYEWRHGKSAAWNPAKGYFLILESISIKWDIRLAWKSFSSAARGKNGLREDTLDCLYKSPARLPFR